MSEVYVPSRSLYHEKRLLQAMGTLGGILEHSPLTAKVTVPEPDTGLTIMPRPDGLAIYLEDAYLHFEGKRYFLTRPLDTLFKYALTVENPYDTAFVPFRVFADRDGNFTQEMLAFLKVRQVGFPVKATRH